MISKRLLNSSMVSVSLALIVAFSSISVAAEDISVAVGARVYNDNCSRCHNPKPAEHYTAREWSVIMPHMRDRAHLTRQESEAVELFLASTLTADVAREMSSGDVATAHEERSGEEMFNGYGCLGCHRLKDTGGTLGPRLGVTLREKGDDFMVQKILNPALGSPSSTMPRFPVTEAEARSIVEYVRSVVEE
jgi:mono/diheme cytochrome c family protein